MTDDPTVHTDTADLAWVECDLGRFVADADGAGFYEIHLAKDAFSADAYWRFSHTTDPERVYAGQNLYAAKAACAADMVQRTRKLAWEHYMAANDPPIPAPNVTLHMNIPRGEPGPAVIYRDDKG